MMFRLTRPEAYPPGCPGHTNSGARQGHYVEASNPIEAITEVAKRKPDTNIWDVQVKGDGPWEVTQAIRYSKHGNEWKHQ